MRMEFDYYIHELEDGQSLLRSTILLIHKGTITHRWLSFRTYLTKVLDGKLVHDYRDLRAAALLGGLF